MSTGMCLDSCLKDIQPIFYYGAVDSQLLYQLEPEDDAGDVSTNSASSVYPSPYEVDLVNLPPMTFKPGRRTDDFDDFGSSEVDSDEEIDGRNKVLYLSSFTLLRRFQLISVQPLPAPPASTTLLSPESHGLLASNSPSNISHIPNFSTSTVSSYTTASSTSSVPVTPITPNTPVTPFLSTSPVFPSSTSLSRASSFSRTQSPTVAYSHSGPGIRSRQPSIVSLAGGYHLPTMVAGKNSPTIGHKSSLPLLNDTDIDADVDPDVDGYFSRVSGETNRPAARLTRQPSLGSRPGLDFRIPLGSTLSSPLGSEALSAGVMRRYASAGNLFSTSLSRPGSSNSGHQHSYSHPTSFPTASAPLSPYSSTPSPFPDPSLEIIPSSTYRAGSSAAPASDSRNRSRAGSTVLRNAVYIEALDSSEVERRLLNLPSVYDRDHSEKEYSDPSASEREQDNIDFEQSKWSPASSVVDLRSLGPKISTDVSSNLNWGLPKMMGVHAPPPTPSTPFSASRSGSYIGLADAGGLISPTADDVPRRNYLSLNITKRKSLNAAASSIPSPSSPSQSQSDPKKSQGEDMSVPPVTPGRRQRLASFIARMAGNTASQIPPVPLAPSASLPVSPANAAPSAPSAPPSPTKSRTTQYRPAPLDLSLKPKNFPTIDSGSTAGTSEPSTPAYSGSTSSWNDDSGSETETENEEDMEDMDPDLIAVAAGLDLPSAPISPRTPRPRPSSQTGKSVSGERGSDFPSTPTGMDDDTQMVRGSYAQVYGFRLPKAPSSPLAAQSFTYLPSTHSQIESSVPRGATPTLVGTQSLIGPGDLPPSVGSPKTPRNRKISMINTSTSTTASAVSQPPSSPPRMPPSSPPRQLLKSPNKVPKTKGGRMSGLISRFTLGSSTSLAVSPHSMSPDSVPPVPPLNVDELGQVVSDPFAKDDLTTINTTAPARTLSSVDSVTLSSVLNSPVVLSNEVNAGIIITRRERSGTTATATSTFSSSTADSSNSTSNSSPERQSLAKKKRRSLGLTLGTVSIGSMGGMRSPTKGINRGKKRKLVISGIESDDSRAYQAVKIWCESFGELKKFERQPNGDLVVDWRNRSVSDMVCRLQANVSIKGAGSVAISWIQS
ncbi:uncharacterized protein C8R40DRAFT_1167617 [Lentinula edodes]|uniref:uncharacterized protein n=1 Tax=Lentinula edodes TaxID=5353 RepID=UPI001E8E10AB|nr:uncharacterized protein C8R40DRAFT_1167617 [Lentinula edodes]KAH7878219.1 hypothetical protein C8R40DRAFT_1167617 [Lentinula edodes]